MDQFGVLNQKLCHVELPCTLCDHLAITSQPIIKWSWNRTFWKGERKIYNFHVHEKSIWSFFDVEKSSWMWTRNLPFSETFNYRSLSIFGNFCPDFKIFKIDVWNDKWTSFEYDWRCCNSFPYLITLSSCTVDFLWSSDDLAIPWSAWASTTWGIGTEMKP